MMLTIRQNATSLLLFLEWGRHFRRGITQNNSGENFTLRMVNDWIRRGQADSNQKKKFKYIKIISILKNTFVRIRLFLYGD